MIIGTEYKSTTINDRTVTNIPYKKHDHPCWEGCCKHELSISLGNSTRVSWLLYTYLIENDIATFDFIEDWSDEVEIAFKSKISKM